MTQPVFTTVRVMRAAAGEDTRRQEPAPGTLALLIGNYDLGKDSGDATFVTWNGHPSHLEWNHKPTGAERQEALAAAQRLTGHKLKSWGHWFNPRTALHFVSVTIPEEKKP